MWLLSFLLPLLADVPPFPPELTRFDPTGEIVFQPRPGEWDAKHRERGWIMRRPDSLHLWFTGYAGAKADRKRVGHATSRDGRVWTRTPAGPLLPDRWVEDMCVVEDGAGLLHMFAEGERDRAQRLTSRDGLAWEPAGTLDVRQANGQPLSDDPFGTPTVRREGARWRLYYERNDAGVWLAESTDLQVWRNVRDEPVIPRGPADYDRHAVALNQIVKRGDWLYGYYHAADTPDWKAWSTCLAASRDGVAWTKYPGNPILKNNESSGIVVELDGRLWLYTMHGAVRRHRPLN